MIRGARKWAWAAVLAALLFTARPARATIDYSVSVAHPEKHVLGVTMRVPNVHDRVLLQMPAWYGLYPNPRFFFPHVAGSPRKTIKETPSRS